MCLVVKNIVGVAVVVANVAVVSIDVAIVIQLRVCLLQMRSNRWIRRILRVLLILLLVHVIVGVESVVFLLAVHIWYVIRSIVIVSPVWR